MPNRGSRSEQADASKATREKLRMRDVVRETGLPRETIHFYLSEGLLPRPTKTGRNTAFYSWEHVRRARLIKSVQEKHFLPLRAIRALLEDAEDSSLSAPQQALIQELRVHLGPATSAQNRQRVFLNAVLEQTGISKKEMGEFRDRRIIAIEGAGRQASVSRDDAELLHAWARLKAVGISPERGFMPGDIAIIEEAISRLVRWEIEFFTERYASVGGEEAARVAEEALPILNQIISIVYLRKMWSFIAGFSEKGRLAEPAPFESRRKNTAHSSVRPRKH